jgi:hypothetical protein
MSSAAKNVAEAEDTYRAYNGKTIVRRPLRADEARHVAECMTFGCPLCIELGNRGAA